jgi:hypothetical protein
MSVDANKTIVRRLFEEVWNQGNLAVIDEISDAVHAAYERPSVTIWRTAFPDLHIKIDDMAGKSGLLRSSLPAWQTPLCGWRSAMVTASTRSTPRSSAPHVRPRQRRTFSTAC